LGAKKTATDKELKILYLKAAKQYHPDVYKGINVDHFKRVAEAYATLKNPIKRKDYERLMKIKTTRSA
jgi:curved DNA-binding protein